MRRRLSGTFGCAIALAALTWASGCGSDSAGGEDPIPAPSASEFPDPGGKDIDSFIADVGETNEVVAAQSEGVFVPGQTRFGFALFDVAGPQIDDADVAVYVQNGPSGKLEGPFTARNESLSVQSAYRSQLAADSDASSVYVADVPLEKGKYRAAAVIRGADGNFSATNFQSGFPVTDQPSIPAVGDPAPDIHTLTLDDVSDPAEIDTRVPPSTMHTDDLADDLGKKPIVLLFATPALCMSRVCGPVVDVAEQVQAEYGNDVAFIHQEIYVDNKFDPKNPQLRPQVQAYGLFTEPWLFVIDSDGRIATRIEGAFSVNELDDAVKDVLE